jgi:hypothetical protein
MWGIFKSIPRNSKEHAETNTGGKPWNPNLRSTHDVAGHTIQASDGTIGHVEDFIIDDETWALRYIIVDTKDWLPGKKVLISPHWIESISWEESKVFINLTKKEIEMSPEYTESVLVTRNYETGLHKHYNRPGYWHETRESVKHSKGEKL